MQLKSVLIQILLRALVRLHYVSFTAIQWCERRLDEYAGIDEIVAEIIGRDRCGRSAEPPTMIVHVIRPRLH